MKRIKTLKKWGIYQLNDKELKEYTFNIAVIHPDNMECYSSCLSPSDTDMELDTLVQAIEWIKNY